MSHESVVWRGEIDGGFQEQAIGNYPAISDVANKDNIYLSDQGWAYRHFTSPDKTEYWDEILWAGEVTVPPGLNDPVGVFGAEEQTFLFGDGFQWVENPYPLTVSTIGTVTIDGVDDTEEDTAQDYKALFNGTYSGTATYAWKIFEAGVDVTSTHTVTNGTAQTATITFTEVGEYDVQCTVGGTSVDSVKGAMDVLVISSVPVYTVGVVSFVDHPEIFEILPGKNNLRVQYSGTAPVGNVQFGISASPDTSVGFSPGTIGTYGEGNGGYQNFDVLVTNDVTLNTPITVTGAARILGSGDDYTNGTTTFKCEGTLGNIAVTRSPSGTINPSSLPTAVTLTSTQTGNTADQAATTIQWKCTSGGSASARAQLETTFTTPTSAVTNVTLPAGLALGNYQFSCTYSNPTTNPQTKTASILVTVLP